MGLQLNTKRFVLMLILLPIIVVFGLTTKWYKGPYHSWVNDSFGGVVYEVFWCLLFSLPGIWKKLNIALGVFIVTCLLEFLQLWHPPFLTLIRSYKLGGYLLGTVFQWKDFPYYGIGCWLGYRLLKGLDKSGRK